MRRPTSTARRLRPVLAIALALGLGYGGCSEIREDELQCEEAVAHVMGCCEPFKPKVRCEYVKGGCAEESTYPDLSVQESRCIRELSCSELRERGLCSAEKWDAAPREVCS
jgi:hypothetical protein